MGTTVAAYSSVLARIAHSLISKLHHKMKVNKVKNETGTRKRAN
jgi:hypothetical protein